MGERDQTRIYSRKESVVFLKTDEPFGGLSNMAGGYPIHVNGVRILTSEALYQVCRFPHLPDVQKMIIGQVSPMTAKMRSKPYRKDSRVDWDQVRVRVMRWCLRMKLANNWNRFSELLLRTGERSIVEESRKDDFWGAKVIDDGDTLVGMNVLGRLLMELREQVKQQGPDATLDVAPPAIPQFLLFGRPIELTSAAPPPQAAEEQEQGSLFGGQTVVAVEPAVVPVSAACATPAYEAYRAARMRWLPPVPEHWIEQRAKTFFREVDERSKTGQEELLSVSHLTGVTPRSQKNVTMFKAASYVGSKLCRPGDIVINTLWAWMAALGASRHAGIVSPAYGVYRPHRADSFNPAYLDYLLRTRAYVAEYIGRSTGIRSSRLRLYPNQFLDIALLHPPRSEQDQIVAYLRAQDAHIARFIKAKRDLIGLLTEQKQTIIEGAVTQGLDAATEKRASGIDWIPHIPEHWETCKLKHVAVFNPSRSESTVFRLSDASVSFLPMECITTDGKLQGVESRKTSEVWEGYTYFRRNDVVMAKITPCFENGKGGLLDALPTEIGFGTTEFIVLRAAERRIRPAFLAKLLSLRTFRILGADAMTGAAGQQRVPLGFVKNFRIALPPLDEQDRILGVLETATAEQDIAIERIRSEITLIREYRDRLISDAVTGQVDLRGWQLGPDNAVSDDDLAALGDDEAEPVEETADGDE
ncbi:NADAR domain-containing protein [Achromobacter kerstersii]